MIFQDLLSNPQKQYFTLPILVAESIIPTMEKPIINEPNAHYGVQKFEDDLYYKNISLPLSKKSLDKIFQNNDNG